MKPLPAANLNASASRLESTIGASAEFDTVREDPEVQTMIRQANRGLGALGYTEHGLRHVGLVANISRNILARLGYDARMQELAAIAGYLHDIGNVVSRHNHASTGAILAHSILSRLGAAPDDLAIVMAAIGSHGDDFGRLGEPVNPISAALILADKSDVHRSRVRKSNEDLFDQHDRVNFAATASFVRVQADRRTVTLELTIDTEIASVMEYFEIFLPRMQMCRRAAAFLKCEFHIVMNDIVVL
jgi:uncharacterized protein